MYIEIKINNTNRVALSGTLFWVILFGILFFYNSYRYIFSFNMHTEVAIPLFWKVFIITIMSNTHLYLGYSKTKNI